MKIDIISRFPLFAGLPRDEIKYLAETLQDCEFLPGEILFHEGSTSEHFFILLEGEVEIIKSLGTSDERLIAVRGKGSMLGEMSIFSADGSHSASVRARSHLRLLEMTLDQFNALLHRYPELAYDLLRLLSRRLQESENITIIDLREKNRQLTLAYEELKAAQAEMIEKKKMEHELGIASEIQRSILPQQPPERQGLDFGALMVPARLVGGDFYDFIPLNEDQLAIVVGDVCDKGMPAALFMALTYSSVRTETTRQDTPGDALRAVNQHLLQVNRSNMFVTLLYGVLDARTRQFTYARAGHPEPLLLDRHNQPVKVAVARGQPVGLFEEMDLDEQTITIPPGGTMLVYSDGLSESLETRDSPLTLPALCASLLEGRNLTAQDLCGGLWRALGAATSESLIQDDFTVVALKDLSA